MARKITLKQPVPERIENWFCEIALGYQGAEQFIKSSAVARPEGAPKPQPWMLAPTMAAGLRGLDSAYDELDKISELAYTRLESSYGLDGELPPAAAFAFVYLATHQEMKLITQEQLDIVWQAVESRFELLEQLIVQSGELMKKNNCDFPMSNPLEAAPAPAPKKPARRSRGASKK